MRQRGRNRKCKALQDWAAAMISGVTGLAAGKDCHIEGRESGMNGPDVRLSPLAREVFPWTVECHNAQSWKVHQKIAQVKANLYPGTDWVVFLKRNNEPSVAVMDAEAFFRLVGEGR